MKLKLFQLLLATITITLLLVGVALNFLIHSYYQKQSEEEFSRLFSQLAAQIRQAERDMKDQVINLSLNDQLISTVNMVHQYARPESYEPLIFDNDKERLASRLESLAKSSGIDLISVYTGRGELIAFTSNDGKSVSGYQTYNQGRPELVIGENQDDDRPEQLSLYPPLSIEANGYTPFSYTISGDSVALQISVPVERAFPGGETFHRIGYILAHRVIDYEIIQRAASSAGIELMVETPTGKRIATLVADIPPPTSSPARFDINAADHQYPIISHPGYYLSAAALPLANGGAALFTAFVSKQLYRDAINNALLAVLPILLIAALLVVPIGNVVATRIITRPIENLVEGVRAIREGNLSYRLSRPGRDEIGILARAINDMANAIERRNRKIEESEGKYRTLVENIPQRVFVKDQNCTYISCNRSYAIDLGISANDIGGRTDFHFFPEELADKYRTDDRQVMASGLVQEFEEPYILAGQERLVHTVKSPIRNERGDVIGILGAFWDITERKRDETRLRQSATVFENTAEGVLITDSSQRIIAVNRAFSEITGYSESEVLGHRPNIRRSDRHDNDFYEKLWQTVNAKGSWRGEIWNRRKSGEVNPEWMTISEVRDEHGKLTNYVGVFSDISAIKHSEERLEYMAMHDPLTALPNRLMITNHLRQAVVNAKRSAGKVALLFLDLDRFKDINDSLGHPIGDQVLKDAANRLLPIVEPMGVLARIGGDEFVVVTDSFSARAELEALSEQVMEALRSPFLVEQHELFIGGSVGISIYPDDGENEATLIRNADAAMYRAKEQGRDAYHFYTRDMTTKAVERVELETALRYALERNELSILYQPQIDLDSRQVVSAEALLRWQNETLGLVYPDRFIPLAEDTGLIVPIGRWVLNGACKQLQAWRQEGLAIERVSVNLSGIQLQRPGLVESVRDALTESSLPAESLELEITESTLMRDPEQVLTVLKELKSLGVQLAVDDFGTGYSSLAYLKRFPIDSLKVDKSFVMDLHQDENDQAITRGVIALGHSLQLKIIAEGVEGQAHEEFLTDKGCEMAQGYYYSRPIPPESIRSVAHATIPTL